MAFVTVQAMTPVIQGLKSASHHHWPIFSSFSCFTFCLFCLGCIVLFFFFLSLFLKAPLNCDWAGGVPNGTQHVGGVFFLGR